ncbi:MAG TPA: hypothetical protein VFS39_04170 [Nitrospira sp.]|nr:hypothetical protein [Nitrospira sp.]
MGDRNPMPEIPDDVMRAAERCHSNIIAQSEGVGLTDARAVYNIANAIMAERERCERRCADLITRIHKNDDPARSAYFHGKLLIAHPDMPLHYWDGKQMVRLEIGPNSDTEVEP